MSNKTMLYSAFERWCQLEFQFDFHGRTSSQHKCPFFNNIRYYLCTQHRNAGPRTRGFRRTKRFSNTTRSRCSKIRTRSRSDRPFAYWISPTRWRPNRCFFIQPLHKVCYVTATKSIQYITFKSSFRVLHYDSWPIVYTWLVQISKHLQEYTIPVLKTEQKLTIIFKSFWHTIMFTQLNKMWISLSDRSVVVAVFGRVQWVIGFLFTGS